MERKYLAHNLSAWESMGFEPKTCGVKDKGDNHLASMTGFVRATGLVRCLVIEKPQRAYVSQNMILRETRQRQSLTTQWLPAL